MTASLNSAPEVKPTIIMALFPSQKATEQQMQAFADVIKPSLLGEAGTLVRIRKGDEHEQFLLDCCMRWGTPRAVVDRATVLDGATHAVLFMETDSLEFDAIRRKCMKQHISTNELTFDARETHS